MRQEPYSDRSQAGRELARTLSPFAGRRSVVLGLARGGVPVAWEVARALGSRLDVFVVRKLGAPAFPELALGAIASGGGRVLRREAVESLGISTENLTRIESAERVELERRERAYRGNRPPLDLAGKTALLVDDGLATGATMAAAVWAARKQGAARVVAAVPVGSREACADLASSADVVVCALTPRPFFAVGSWYERFEQTSDDEVRMTLLRAR